MAKAELTKTVSIPRSHDRFDCRQHSRISSVGEEGEGHDEDGGIENIVVFVGLRIKSKLFVAVAARIEGLISLMIGR